MLRKKCLELDTLQCFDGDPVLVVSNKGEATVDGRSWCGEWTYLEHNVSSHIALKSKSQSVSDHCLGSKSQASWGYDRAVGARPSKRTLNLEASVGGWDEFFETDHH